MNKLRQNLFTKKPWGSEIIWALTDNYMCKTIDITKGKRTPLIVPEEKERSIKVKKGPLYLTYGSCCDESTVPIYKIPEGWSWYIEPGMMFRYSAMESQVTIEEISTPQLEDGIILVDEDGIEVIPTAIDVKTLADQSDAELKEKEKPKTKRRRRTKKS